MPPKRKFTSNAQRQVSRHARLRLEADDPIRIPVSAGPLSMPSTARWRSAVDKSNRLMQMLSAEMQDYADQRSDHWQEGESAQRFRENLDQVNELQGQLDELRSNF